jgi:surface antigen
MKSRQVEGRKWQPSRMLNTVDVEVDHQIHFPGQVGRAGIGHGNFNPNPSKSQRRKLVAKVIRDFADEKRIAHAHSLARQGVWLQWSDSTIPFDFSWKNLLFGPGEHVLKFVLNASVNWVKTPDLLKLWGYKHQDLCKICGSAGCTLHHILSNCDAALRQRRYNWRHDSVLQHILTVLSGHVTSLASVQSAPSDYKIAFVRAGKPVKKTKVKRKAKSLLDCASDWKIQADFDSLRFCFPAEICSTGERPDLVVWSSSAKVVILVELTCPAEEGIQNATNRKVKRYIDLQLLIRENGWTPHLFTIEVGARGFVAKSTIRMFRSLGLSHSSTSKCAKELSVIAAKCSYAIYLARDCVHWDSKQPLLQLSHQEEKKGANSDGASLSEQQIRRMQENKEKALAKLASKGRQAISVSANADDVVSAKEGKLVANSVTPSLSEHQIHRMQENKKRALVKLACRRSQAISVSANADDVVSAKEGKSVANSVTPSLSEHQIHRMQENKKRALAKLACRRSQAISVSAHAAHVVPAKVKCVKWSDSSGGSLTTVRTFMLNLAEARQQKEHARAIREKRKQPVIGPETVFLDPIY